MLVHGKVSRSSATNYLLHDSQATRVLSTSIARPQKKYSILYALVLFSFLLVQGSTSNNLHLHEISPLAGDAKSQDNEDMMFLYKLRGHLDFIPYVSLI